MSQAHSSFRLRHHTAEAEREHVCTVCTARPILRRGLAIAVAVTPFAGNEPRLPFPVTMGTQQAPRPFAPPLVPQAIRSQRRKRELFTDGSLSYKGLSPSKRERSVKGVEPLTPLLSHPILLYSCILYALTKGEGQKSQNTLKRNRRLCTSSFPRSVPHILSQRIHY